MILILVRQKKSHRVPSSESLSAPSALDRKQLPWLGGSDLSTNHSVSYCLILFSSHLAPCFLFICPFHRLFLRVVTLLALKINLIDSEMDFEFLRQPIWGADWFGKTSEHNGDLADCSNLNNVREDTAFRIPERCS